MSFYSFSPCEVSSPPPVPQPEAKPQLKSDETIINPFYMRQLLQYAYRMAKEGRQLTEAEQIEEAEACVEMFRLFTIF